MQSDTRSDKTRGIGHDRAVSSSAIEKIKAIGSGIFGRSDSSRGGEQKARKGSSAGAARAGSARADSARRDARFRRTRSDGSGSSKYAERANHEFGYPGVLAQVVAPIVSPEVAARMMGTLRSMCRKPCGTHQTARWPLGASLASGRST